MPVTPTTRRSLSTNDKAVKVLDAFAAVDLGDDVLVEPRRLLARYRAIERRERDAPSAAATSVDRLAGQITNAPGDAAAVPADIDAALTVLADERARSIIVEQTVSVLATAAHHTAGKFTAAVKAAGEPLLALLDAAAQAATVDLARAIGKMQPGDTDRAAMLGARPPRDARAAAHQALARLEALTEAWQLLIRAPLVQLGPLKPRAAHPDDLAEFRFDNPIVGRTLSGWDVDEAERIVEAGPRFLNTAQHTERDRQLAESEADHREAVAAASRVVERARRGRPVTDEELDAAVASLVDDPAAAADLEARRRAQTTETRHNDPRAGEGRTPPPADFRGHKAPEV